MEREPYVVFSLRNPKRWAHGFATDWQAARVEGAKHLGIRIEDCWATVVRDGETGEAAWKRGVKEKGGG